MKNKATGTYAAPDNLDVKKVVEAFKKIVKRVNEQRTIETCNDKINDINAINVAISKYQKKLTDLKRAKEQHDKLLKATHVKVAVGGREKINVDKRFRHRIVEGHIEHIEKHNKKVDAALKNLKKVISES